MGTVSSIAVWGDSMVEGADFRDSLPVMLVERTSADVHQHGKSRDTSTDVLRRLLARPEAWDFPTVIWVGRCNYQDHDRVVADHAEIRSFLTGPAIALPVFKAEEGSVEQHQRIDELNADLAKLWGGQFWDAQALLSLGQPVTLSSFRVDKLHLNRAGNAALATYIRGRFNLPMGSGRLINHITNPGPTVWRPVAVEV